MVECDTFSPGYYAGRAIHIHFNVYPGGATVVTAQALLPTTIDV